MNMDSNISMIHWFIYLEGGHTLQIESTIDWQFRRLYNPYNDCRITS